MYNEKNCGCRNNRRRETDTERDSNTLYNFETPNELTIKQ